MELFKQFIEDEEAWDFYITGPAGTGKTTLLKEYVQLCDQMDLKVQVCAYTHKACNVLRTKLPKNVEISTLHSFIQKRPTINDSARKVQQIESNTIMGSIEERPQVLMIDEFSMIGEQDLMDLRNLQDPDYDGKPALKIVWIGDPYQLPPVKDMEAVTPREPYLVRLKEIKRSAKDNKLQQTISKIVSFIDGTEKAALLQTHDTFRKCEDLFEEYKLDSEQDKIYLAYTNNTVQFVNRELAGRDYPMAGDELFYATVNRYFTFINEIHPNDVVKVDRFWNDPLERGSKYKTLEFLIEQNFCTFYEVMDEEGKQFIFATCFGTYDYKVLKERYGKEAVEVNQEIQSKFKDNPAVWAKNNYTHPLARKRALAWRKYLTIKELACMDFSYAMTVHKSQGSTFKHVYLNAEDLSLCMNKNFDLYLRLYYVGISRASQFVVTN